MFHIRLGRILAADHVARVLHQRAKWPETLRTHTPFSFQDVEATAEWRAPSPHSKARRSEGGTEARVTCLHRLVDRLHQSNHIVRLIKAAQLLGGLADIAVVDVSQEAPITSRAHHCIIPSTVSGLLTRPSSTWTKRQFGK
jgi:hypothetical protein